MQGIDLQKHFGKTPQRGSQEPAPMDGRCHYCGFTWSQRKREAKDNEKDCPKCGTAWDENQGLLF
jgi:predicted Zn-ribbon and HTH transcriptional regulator